MEDQPSFVDQLRYEQTRPPRILVVENALTIAAFEELCTKKDSGFVKKDGVIVWNGCELILHPCLNIDILKAVHESNADGLIMRMGGQNEALTSMRRLHMAGVKIPVAVQMRGMPKTDEQKRDYPIKLQQLEKFGALGLFDKKDENQPALEAVKQAVLQQRERALY